MNKVRVIKNIFNDFKLWICNFLIGYIPSHTIRLFYYCKIMKFEIGNGSSIHLGCVFNDIGKFKLGKNSTINQFCRIDNRGGVYIEDNVSVSPYCKLITATHFLKKYSEFPNQNFGKIIIEDYCFIGSDSMILQNLTMKRGSVLGAKSLLTRDTLPNGMYLGTPAELKSLREEDGTYSASYQRWFH